MEMEFFGNKLKLENNEIYNYRKTSPNSKKMDWCKISFSLNNNGYLCCKLTNENNVKRAFLFHRLMYLFHNPDFDIFNPTLLIDHINRDTLDNSIDNLRIATYQENQWNRNGKGCSYHKKSGKWMAYIRINKKLINLGYFLTEKEAHEKYLQAKKEYHFIPKK